MNFEIWFLACGEGSGNFEIASQPGNPTTILNGCKRT